MTDKLLIQKVTQLMDNRKGDKEVMKDYLELKKGVTPGLKKRLILKYFKNNQVYIYKFNRFVKNLKTIL